MAILTNDTTAETSHDQPGEDLTRNQLFDKATREKLRADDSFAWKSVVGVLLAIVGFGLALTILAVAIAVATPGG